VAGGTPTGRLLASQPGDGTLGEEERKQFFFGKKNQKTFILMAHVAGENRDSDVKVFASFL
jgi:hypothetical protein